ncbi:hypothetical protein Agub_g9441, partial [Astrephomene gubernaculifera]
MHLHHPRCRKASWNVSSLMGVSWHRDITVRQLRRHPGLRSLPSLKCPCKQADGLALRATQRSDIVKPNARPGSHQTSLSPAIFPLEPRQLATASIAPAIPSTSPGDAPLGASSSGSDTHSNPKRRTNNSSHESTSGSSNSLCDGSSALTSFLSSDNGHVRGPGQTLILHASTSEQTTPAVLVPRPGRRGAKPAPARQRGPLQPSNPGLTPAKPASAAAHTAAVHGSKSSPLPASAAAAAAPPEDLAAQPPPPTVSQLQQHIKRLQRCGRNGAALDLSYEAMSYYPEIRSFWATVGSLESRMGRHDAALKVLEEGLKRWPGNPGLLTALGRARASIGDRAGARAAFKTAAKREPNNPVLLQAWALVEAEEGDLPAARRLFRGSIRADPRHAAAYTAWARMEAAAGGEVEARRLFVEGHAASPDHVPLLHAWAAFEEQQGKPQEARRLLQEALQREPQHMPSWMALGRLEWRQGSPAAARRVFQAGLAQVGGAAPLLGALGELELRMRNVRRARNIFRAAPRHVPALISAAMLEHRAGNSAKAEELYAQAAAAVEAGVVRESEGAPRRPWRSPFRSGDAADDSGAAADTDSASGDATRADTPNGVGDAPPATMPQSHAEGQEEGRGADVEASASSADLGKGGRRGGVLTSDVVLLHARAMRHLRDGDLAAAEKCLAAVEEVDPYNGYLCHTRGLLSQREGATDMAELWFRRGLSCRKRGGRGALLCYEGLAELLAFLGRSDAARAVWQEGAAAVHPTTSRFLRQAALFEKRERNWGAARALFADAVRRDPQDYRSWLKWGVFERGRAKWAAAERCFLRGTELAPGNPHIWYSYATMLIALGQLDRARAVLGAATRNCPRCAPLWMEWAMMEAAAGQVEKARTLFKMGSDVPPANQHAPLYQAWAALEARQGDTAAAAQLSQRAEQLLAGSPWRQQRRGG